jgi:hypothetical protein
MKIISSKSIFVGMIFGCFAMISFGQSSLKPVKQNSKETSKIDKNKVPLVVNETHSEEYPITTSESWYSYPSFDNESDWFGYDEEFYSNEYPEYYIVEFTQDNISRKVIYSKTGKKIVTHIKLNSDIPSAVSISISKGEYKIWKLMKDKEEIFKDSDSMKVYKVEVEKGKERHALFYSTTGELLKDKKIKP